MFAGVSAEVDDGYARHFDTVCQTSALAVSDAELNNSCEEITKSGRRKLFKMLSV